MRLSQILASQVSNRSRARGSQYFLSGAVASLEMTDGLIEATVVGGSAYVVLIDTKGGRLQASCTCPYFSDRFDICKHVWAVLLAAEERGMPILPSGSPAGRLVLEPMETDPYDDVDDDEPVDADEILAQIHQARQQAAQKPGKPKPSQWQQRLQAISPPPAAVTPVHSTLSTGQLVYVIDVQASLAARAVVIELMVRTRKTNGDWAKPKPARIPSGEIRALPDEQDRRLLQRLAGARHEYSTYGPAYSSFAEIHRVQLGEVLAEELLPGIGRTGRCLARVALVTQGAAPATPQPVTRWGWARPTPLPDTQTTLLPLAHDAGEPWLFTMGIRRDDADGGYVVEGRLTRGDAHMPPSEPLLVVMGGMLVTRTHVARLDDRGAYTWLAALRQGPMNVPDADRVPFIDAMLAEAPPVADLPEALRVKVEAGIPRPHLQLHPSRYRPEQLEATLSWDYDGLDVSASAPAPIVRTSDASRVIRRDVGREREASSRLYQVGFRREWSPTHDRPMPQLAARHLPRVVRTLLAEQWLVEAKGFVYRAPISTGLRVTSGVDWFDLEGHADYGTHRVPLPELLAALRRGDGFVRLGDGSLGLLPEDWLHKQGLLADLGTTEGSALRFKPSQAVLLDALLAQQPAVAIDEAFARARARLDAFDGIAPVDPPPAFAGTLRGYQREGLGWLLFLRQFGLGGCLADDMGLGKTVMVLALLAQVHARTERDRPSARPSLVVAPRSLGFNWQQEAARFAPDLRVLDYTGIGRTDKRGTFADHDVVLTTYGTLRRDAADLAQLEFEYVVLDESQAIKNAASASAKAVRLLRARHRLALSGTPIENHLGELWSLFEFLNPGMLGASSAFQRLTAGSADDDALVALARGLRPLMLRRTKEQVATELPPKTEQTIYCELERPQRALYNELRDHYRGALLERVSQVGLGRAKLQVLEALLRLRQAACHPGLIDKKRGPDASAKLDVLLPRLAEAVDEGHKTLVFSQFTSLLAILRRQLDADGITYEYLDGRTRDRQAKVERFQTDDSCRLFLISLKAGGVGLNLTAAEYVFLLDPWWNPAVEAQAIDRTHRIGQSRHVFAYRLIAKNTVEERVLELQQHKRKLADAVLSADGSLLRDLKREDLELLLS